MGEIRTKVLLENQWGKAGSKGKRPVMTIDAVVDTGAVMTLLPQEVVEMLKLKTLGMITVLLANDQKIELPRTEGFSLTVAGRQMFTDALVGPPGCEPLIGQLVMERLDLIADPARRRLTPRPESPYQPTLKLKSVVDACRIAQAPPPRQPPRTTRYVPDFS